MGPEKFKWKKKQSMCIKYPHVGTCTDHKRNNMKKYVYVYGVYWVGTEIWKAE